MHRSAPPVGVCTGQDQFCINIGVEYWQSSSAALYRPHILNFNFGAGSPNKRLTNNNFDLTINYLTIIVTAFDMVQFSFAAVTIALSAFSTMTLAVPLRHVTFFSTFSSFWYLYHSLVHTVTMLATTISQLATSLISKLAIISISNQSSLVGKRRS
jgi:hypothetical protein